MGSTHFLDKAFYAIDSVAFGFFNSIKNPFFTWISNVFAIIGKGGIGMIILAIILLLFKRTRKAGFCVAISIIVGAIFTNVIIKNVVARPRPYTNEEYKAFWQAVGAHTESEFSFPSGHVTVTMATMTAMFLTFRRKGISSLLFIPVVIMACSRNYLIVHYLTDVLAGIIVGGIASTIGYFINRSVYKIIEKNENNKFCSFLINADILDLFKRKKRG